MTTEPFNCPVCDSCDHDLRASILELTTNIMSNFKAACEVLIDGMEGSGSGAGEFSQALHDLAVVDTQVRVLMSAVPEIAIIKANAE